MIFEISKYVGKDDANLAPSQLVSGFKKSRSRAIAKGDDYKVEHYTKQIKAIEEDLPKAFRRHLESIYAFKSKTMITYSGEYKPRGKAAGESFGKFIPTGYTILEDIGTLIREVGSIEVPYENLAMLSLTDAMAEVREHGKVIISEQLDLKQILTPESVKAVFKLLTGRELDVTSLPDPIESYYEMNVFNAETISKAITPEVMNNLTVLKKVFDEEH